MEAAEAALSSGTLQLCNLIIYYYKASAIMTFAFVFFSNRIAGTT